MEWLYVISALASAVAAALAWAAKLWWSKEYAAAKDEIIRAKDAQIALLDKEIQNLRELTPMKIREYFLSVRKQLEEYNELLNKELEEARKEIEDKNIEIEHLKSEDVNKSDEVINVEKKRDLIQKTANSLENQLGTLREQFKDKSVRDWKFSFDKALFNNISGTSNQLRNLIAHRIEQDEKSHRDQINNYLMLVSNLMDLSSEEGEVSEQDTNDNNKRPNKKES